MNMKTLLASFENKKPEILFEWSDPESEAVGWLVINSLRGGAAGGGTRMRKGLDRREVESLAKTMEIKFTVSGPPIGGAKSGIDFDPNDPRKKDVLKRWYRAVYPILKNYYGTGGDLNVDEIHEVIPFTEDYGLWHPQEGIVHGHYHPSQPKKIHMIGRLRHGVSKILEDHAYVPHSDKRYTIADMITGFGVAESIRYFYELWGGEIGSKTAIIQGWGNVGATAALYLAEYGAKIGGIIDRNGGIISEKGLELDEVKQLFHDREESKLIARDLLSFEECNTRIWKSGAHIFVPAAASRLVSRDQITDMIAHGLELISCGANVPFEDPEIFYGPISELADESLSLIPDFVANCGMARTFAYLMDPASDGKITDAYIFSDISAAIRRALEQIREDNPGRTKITQSAYKLALEQLV
jgi:glutamate dehydrogenase/leucine dehydrogenase